MLKYFQTHKFICSGSDLITHLTNSLNVGLGRAEPETRKARKPEHYGPEIMTKNKKISLIEEKIGKYMDGFSLTNLETEDILSGLNQKCIKKHMQHISRRNSI